MTSLGGVWNGLKVEDHFYDAIAVLQQETFHLEFFEEVPRRSFLYSTFTRFPTRTAFLFIVSPLRLVALLD